MYTEWDIKENSEWVRWRGRCGGGEKRQSIEALRTLFVWILNDVEEAAEAICEWAIFHYVQDDGKQKSSFLFESAQWYNANFNNFKSDSGFVWIFFLRWRATEGKKGIFSQFSLIFSSSSSCWSRGRKLFFLLLSLFISCVPSKFCNYLFVANFWFSLHSRCVVFSHHFTIILMANLQTRFSYSFIVVEIAKFMSQSLDFTMTRTHTHEGGGDAHISLLLYSIDKSFSRSAFLRVCSFQIFLIFDLI